MGTEVPARPAQNSVGGRPFLDEGPEWPECFCGERTVLFFQLDVPSNLKPFGGDPLLAFHRRARNDASSPELSDGRLVRRYWGPSRTSDDGTSARAGACAALEALVGRLGSP